MEEGMWIVLKTALLIIIAISIILLIYFLRDTMHEKISSLKDIFSNIFKFF